MARRTVGQRTIKALDRRVNTGERLVQPARFIDLKGPRGSDADDVPDLAEGDRIEFRGTFFTVAASAPNVVVLVPAKGLEISVPRKEMSGAKVVAKGG